MPVLRKFLKLVLSINLDAYEKVSYKNSAVKHGERVFIVTAIIVPRCLVCCNDVYCVACM